MLRLLKSFRTDNDDSDTIESESDGRQSGAAGEIDLHNFFGAAKGQDKEHKKRKFETSSTRNTFVTTGKPTIINVNLSTDNNDNGDKDDDNDTREVIVTAPISTTDEQTTSRIRPQSSSSIRATLSGTVTSRTSPIVSSVRLGGFQFPKRPRPDIFNNNNKVFSEEEIKDDEVLNKNVEAAIVEQVPEHILSVEDQDPQTKCKATCGENEMCHINAYGRTVCKCRPGFGKPTNLPDSKCESKQF